MIALDELTQTDTDFDLTQIINGIEITMPSPFAHHQTVAKKLFRYFDSFVSKQSFGEVFFAPLDVILQQHINRVQPDLIVVSHKNADIVQDFIRGVPDLVLEVVSQGSYKIDTVDKKAIYQQHGVQEYWVVLPKDLVVMVYALNADTKQYELHSIAEEKGSVTSKLLDGLSIDITTIFE